MTDVCLACQIGLKEECYNRPGIGCKTKPVAERSHDEPDDGDDHRSAKSLSGKSRRRTLKEDSLIEDAKSTGRKRAALLYPLPGPGESPLSCEWKGLRKAGGGEYPIIGCINGTASHRHHGPDKNTLNNEQGNVHRICTHCHNRWHALNDLNYPIYRKKHLTESDDGSITFSPTPHDSESVATPEELVQNEANWRMKKK